MAVALLKDLNPHISLKRIRLRLHYFFALFNDRNSIIFIYHLISILMQQLGRALQVRPGLPARSLVN